MCLGNLNLIRTVIDLGANIEDTMHDQLGALHCAAQSYHGLVSILYLQKKFNLDPNQRTNKEATPLHFAVTYKEPKNVEAMIKQGCDLNA